MKHALFYCKPTAVFMGPLGTIDQEKYDKIVLMSNQKVGPHDGAKVIRVSEAAMETNG